MTGKLITDYTKESKELLAAKFETPEGQKQYKQRMPMVEPRFAYNKYTLKYRQYHVKGQKSVITQQLLMATAQKHDKNTQHRTKHTKRKHNIHRRIKTKNTKNR